MSNGQDIFIVGAARTAIGTFGGSLSSFRPAELGTIVIKEALERAGIAPADVQNCLLYTSPSPRDATLSRMPSSA